MPPPPAKTLRTERALAAGLLLATLLAYARVAGNGFVNFDDPDYVTDNPHVRAGLTAAGAWWALTATDCGNWHPLTWLSLQLDAHLYGPGPWGYHLTNLLVHAANTLLLFRALRRMTGAVWRSAVAAGLFALHPLHVESVAWVAERKDVLSGLFWMLGLCAYERYARRPGAVRYLAVLAAFALGLAAKPMLVTLPCVFLLLDWWPLRRVAGPGARPGAARPWRLVLEKMPLFALAAAACVVTFHAQAKGGAVRSVEAVPVSLRVGNALLAYVRYLGKAAAPADLALAYPLPREPAPAWQAVAAGAFLLGVSLAAVRLARRYPYLPVGWFWYLGTLVPVIGLVQVGDQALADRYTYLPLIGIFLMAAWGVHDLLARWRAPAYVAPALGAAALAACGAGTAWQVGFCDGEALWRRSLAVTGDNYVAHFNLAGLLFREGRLGEAERHYAAAALLRPRSGEAHARLGMVLLHAGRIEEADRASARAVEVAPALAEGYQVRGAVLTRRGDAEGAIAHYREAVRLGPDDAETHNNLGTALAGRGRLTEAVAHLAEARRLDPSRVGTLYNLGLALSESGDGAGAAEAFRAAADREPGEVRFRLGLAHALSACGRAEEGRAQYREASRLDAGWPRDVDRAARAVTHPDPGRRRPRLAVVLAEQACQGTDGVRPEFLETLAVAYAAAGRADDAAGQARLALERAAGRPELAAALRERLGGYLRKPPRAGAAAPGG